MSGEQRLALVAKMKAICLLLCLALARDCAGHIFRRNSYNPRVDSSHVQNTVYFEPEQQSEDNEKKVEQYRKENERYYDNSQSDEQERYQRNAEQQNEKIPRREHYDGQQRVSQQYDGQNYQEGTHYQRQQKQPDHQSQHLNAIYKQQHQKNQHSQERTENMRTHQQSYDATSTSSASNSNENVKETPYPQSQHLNAKYQTQQHQRKQRSQERAPNMRTPQQSYDAHSSESNSYEDVTENRYATPVYADNSVPTSKLISKRIHIRKPVSGDSIAWKSVQIATGPKFSVNKEEIEKIFEDAYETMNHASKENKIIFHQVLEEAIKSGDEDVNLNATELLNKHQYKVETHKIKTDDGYYLTLFRIPPKEQTPQRPVVFLMHGLLGSADDWLLMGPGKSLAYMLADAGYDVWLGNARGSKYARRHVSKHPAQADFWQYSNDEIALHDLPTMIDYVLKTSNQEKLYYIGHSQGTTAFFALASSRPEYNNKVIMMYALSPMVYMSKVRSPLLRLIAPTSRFSQKLNDHLGHDEFKPSSELIQTFGGAMCENEIGCKDVCSNVNFVMSGANVEDLEVKLIPVIMGHLPAGASTRQMKQYAQAVASHQFTKYDYGSEINEKVYGSRQPPQYQIEKVQVPVALYYSEDDWLAHPQDVARLEKELPNVKDSYKVSEPHFNNMDFQFSKKAPKVIYNRLIESIQEQEKQNYVY